MEGVYELGKGNTWREVVGEVLNEEGQGEWWLRELKRLREGGEGVSEGGGINGEE